MSCTGYMERFTQSSPRVRPSDESVPPRRLDRETRPLASGELATLPPTGYPFACEKISASAPPFTAFPCPEKSCPPNTIGSPRFYSPTFREREIRAAPAGREHAGGFSALLEEIVDEAQRVQDLGLQAVLLFGVPEQKDEQASAAYAENGIVQKTLRAIKSKCPDLVTITDVCLCEYMSHGHCGVTRIDGDHFHVLNDETVELLVRTALSHAAAGADIVAPSDMMDGRVGAIREALDAGGF